MGYAKCNIISGGCLILKGDRRLDLFCFTKLLTVWHKCPSKASLLRRIRALAENTICNLDRFVIQLASMDSCFSLNLLVHGKGLLLLKLRHCWCGGWMRRGCGECKAWGWYTWSSAADVLWMSVYFQPCALGQML